MLLRLFFVIRFDEETDDWRFAAALGIAERRKHFKARTFEAVKMMASQNQNIINVASPSPPPVDGPSGAVVSSTTITTMKTQSISSTLSSHTNQQQQLQQSNNIEPLDKSSSNTLKVLR